ncbi:hypothetical protein QNI19_34260 [Cytophagaceae bacterium DM2B3-1]|uniref:Lipoprotein n=1 Tax=Xanthocytophaga flava TaxID=3048013 RepID=A0AAE3UBI9_9BACT|nr:hypothetical protein [Xanthocytophaga flavus]MDJ1467405.1 hypothetical protein [Xanthocytophaga flavus]MDJ1484443.1 hypothetical protein [Xanthocytophaga flavus]MDJ1498057.1 hypothetical protein [Xanthocytophaga flavus]
MKKVLLIGLVVVASLSACAKKYTCPTYSKANGVEKLHASVKQAEKGNN